MPRSLGGPRLPDWIAAEKLGPEIRKKVTEDNEHDAKGGIPKRSVDVENTQVEEQYRHLVAKKAEQPGKRPDKDPFLVLLTKSFCESRGMQPHAILGRDACQNAISDDKGVRCKGRIYAKLVLSVLFGEISAHNHPSLLCDSPQSLCTCEQKEKQ